MMTRPWLFLPLILLLSTQNFCLVVQGQAQATGATTTSLDPNDLEGLSNEELEHICIERGFELIRGDDDSDAEALTHEDYVDAAKRCLAIEEDMNTILEQNPELADELVAEIDRMKEEKQRLEQEQEEMLLQKEQLEQQLLLRQQQQQQNAAAAASAEGTNPTRTTSSRMWGTSSASSASAATTTTQQSAFGSSKSSPAEESATTAADAADITITEDEEGEEEDNQDPCSSNNKSSSSAAAASSEGEENATDFTLKGFIQEIMMEFEKDVHRVTTLILPVVKPIYTAGNKAWGYVKFLFQSARKQYKKYKQAQTTQHHQQEQKEQSKSGAEKDILS